MYYSHYQLVYDQKIVGAKIKILNQDDSMVMTEFELQKGTILPEHIHSSNHSAYLLKGRIRMIADGVPSDFFRGDSWCIKKDICHTTEALEDSVVLEVYNPENEKFGNSQLTAESELHG